MSLGATDQLRSLFLKGFKLSKQGNYEDPTYLGFKIVIDFGTLPVRDDDGLPPSPLFREQSYIPSGFSSANPFGQPQYSYRSTPNGAINFYSATSYLREREAEFPRGGKRSDMLIQFKNSLTDLLNNSPWFLQTISGLDQLPLVSRKGFAVESDSDFNPQRTAGKALEFTTLESLNLRMTALADLYNQATFDYDNMRELVPRNLRKFTMYIFVSEIRNFFKTSRLIGASAALTTIDNLATMLGSGNNPGTNLGDVGEQNSEYNGGSSNTNPASGFNSFVGNVLNGAGVDNDLSMLRNQQDQSGVKPVIVFECRNCEFDFSESTPIPSEISAGSDTATPVGQKFRIIVGKVRTRSQYPNIRQDGKPLILGDSWDGARSSVQKNPSNLGDDILSIGGELLTNFLSNSLNDLINEGVATYIKPNVAGLDKLILGNIYSLNPSQVLGNLSFNTAQQYLDQLGNVNAGFRETILPNPQTTGLGGPPQRVYGKVSGDVYGKVPGQDLGVSSVSGIQGRVYPAPGGDAYANVPGPDLGVPDRVYTAPGGDVYNDVPGTALGVPDRVYPAPGGDVYATVPGPDLGVPDRIYPAPGGDVYADVPGAALGVPDRVYPAPGGDVYATVPGPDLGAPDRVYSAPGGDAYTSVPGTDLGVPSRTYPSPGGDVYADVPGTALGVPDRVYPAPGGDVYVDVPGTALGVPDRVYPAPGGDVYDASPGTALGVPDRVYPAPGGDVYADVPGTALGVPDRVYVDPIGDAYTNVPGSDLGVPDRVYPQISEEVYPPNQNSIPLAEQKVYPDAVKSANQTAIEANPVYAQTQKISSNGELRDAVNSFATKPNAVYQKSEMKSQKSRGDIGKAYPNTNGDFMVEKPLDMGNLKPKDKYNISTGGMNPSPEKFE
jgi:hypothetical protein